MPLDELYARTEDRYHTRNFYNLFILTNADKRFVIVSFTLGFKNVLMAPNATIHIC